MTTTSRLAVRYLDERRARGAAQRTLTCHRSILASFAAAVPGDPSRIAHRDVVRWMRGHERLAPATRRAYWSATHTFTDWLRAGGVLVGDPFARLPKPKPVRTVQHALDHDQVGAMLAACRNERDRVIVVLAVQTGLRRAELAALEVGDVSLPAATVTVVRGKGGHSRVVPLSDEACRTLAAYVTGLRAGPLLRSLQRPDRGLAANTVGTLVRRVAYRAGVKVRAWDGVGTHSLRRTMATDVYRLHRDVRAVQQLLGHANLATTQLYVDGYGPDALRSAVEGRRYLDAA